jgi:hypothetical protein
VSHAEATACSFAVIRNVTVPLDKSGLPAGLNE